MDGHECAVARRIAPPFGKHAIKVAGGGVPLAGRELDGSTLEALGERIAGLRLVPDTISLRHGQMFLVRDVRVLAIDQAGAVLGRVIALQWRVRGAALVARGDTVVGAEPWEGALEVLLARPTAPLSRALRVVVRPDTAQTAPTSSRR